MGNSGTSGSTSLPTSRIPLLDARSRFDPNRSLGGIHWIQNFRRFCGLPALAVALVNTGVEEGPPKTVASRSPAQTSQSIRTRA
jgi:hypothetical protein